MPSTEPPLQRTSLLLHALMAAHTAIVAVSVAAVGYILARGLLGGALLDDRLLFAAVIWIVGIGVGRYLNGVECILQTWARRLRGQASGWARDIYWAPESWAMAIPKVFTPAFLIGVALVAGRVLERLD